MKKKILAMLAVAGLSLLTACEMQTEKKGDASNVSSETKIEVNTSEKEKQDSAKSTTESAEGLDQTTTDIKDAEGDWILIAELYYNPEDTNEVNYILPDRMYLERKVSIYEEDGKTRIDYLNNYEESSFEIYGRKLEERDSEGFYRFFEKETEYNTATYDVKLEDPDTIVVRQTYTYEDSKSEYFNYYKRSDCDYEAEQEKYKYTETITVSTVKELYNAIGSHKKIILKAGVYDFSTLSEEDKQNPHVNTSTEYSAYPFEWGTMAQAWCADLNYLALEGEEGADVEICTEDGFLAPLAFYDCSNITLKNLKVGHLVEPGYCAGSVIYLEYSNNITIDNCRLYGSGTYGIESSLSSQIIVRDSDIYECSNGLINFTSTGTVQFDNCTLRDSEFCSMFRFYESAWGVYFTNCRITGNDSGTYDYALIDAENAWGDIHFENCTITDNTYSVLYTGDVTFENCDIE